MSKKGEPISYPTNHIVGILDTQEQTKAVFDALTNSPIPPAEFHIRCGPDAAARLEASTGHKGLVGMLIRVTETLGIPDYEMHVKDGYEKALREGHFLVSVLAPTEERKNLVRNILLGNGAHSVNFMGRSVIETLAPLRVT
jgi:hypothetical protein